MILAALLILLSQILAAQQPPADEERLQRQSAHADELFRQNQIEKAVAVLEAVAADPASRRSDDLRANVLYNLACGYSRLGKKQQGVATLRDAVGAGYSSFQRIQEDTDFDNIRQEPGYREIVASLKARASFWDSPAFKTPYRENLSVEEKLAGLSRFWSEARYNFAWFERLKDLDWDALYLSYIPKVTSTASTSEYYRVMQEFCARLRDGHTNVYAPKELSDENARPALRTRLVEGKVLVIEVLNDKLREDGIVAGLEVVAIDGAPVRQYASERVAPFQSASTPQDLDSRTYEIALLAGPSSRPVDLTLSGPDGRILRKPVPRNLPRMLRSWKAFELTMLPGNIAHVALNSFGDDQAAKAFEAHFAAIRESSALILDVRENGGGSSGVGWKILSFLTDKPFSASAWRTRDYRPAYRAWGRGDKWYGEPAFILQPHAPPRYEKPVVVLTSPRTFSAAEDFAVVFDGMKRGKIIGEPTAGSTGQPLFFALPGGGSARICTKQDRYPDGREFVGVGIQPDILVRPTVADVRAGRDTVLGVAVESLRH